MYLLFILKCAKSVYTEQTLHWKRCTSCFVLPFTSYKRLLAPLQRMTFENIVREKAHAHNEKMLHFSPYFQRNSILIFPCTQIFDHAFHQSISMWISLKIACGVNCSEQFSHWCYIKRSNYILTLSPLRTLLSAQNFFCSNCRLLYFLTSSDLLENIW